MIIHILADAVIDVQALGDGARQVSNDFSIEVLSMVILVIVPFCLAVTAYIEVRRSSVKDRPVVVAGLSCAAVVVGALIIYWLGVFVPKHAAMKQAWEAHLEARDRAQAAVDASLRERYEIVDVRPHVPDGGVSIGLPGARPYGPDDWAPGWLADVYLNSPIDAPTADVVLEGDRVVTWKVIGDPVTGEARFAPAAASGSELNPEDFLREG